jgi:hypothetical protein
MRPRWSLLRTRRSCFSVADIQVSSANRARCIPGAAGASFIYKLYSTGARTEPWGTPAATFLGEESSLSTETLNFLFVRNEAISLTRLLENCSSNSLQRRPGRHVVSKTS